MTSMAECILANEWWCGVTQDALRVDQLAADRKRDVWLPEGLAEARSKTWESGRRENVLVQGMGEVEGATLP